IENGILNTNAKVSGPLFQGNTSMYLDTFSLMKNDELSSFNEEVTLFNKNKDIIIPISKVNKDFAVLKRWSLKLNKNRTKYLDALEQEYNRVSELKGVTGDISIESTVRGDVLDELFRDFFSRSTPHTLDVFLTKANETLFNVSKTKKLLDDKDKPKVNISEKAFKEYYNILTSYSEEFKKKGWQIYTNLKPIGGRLGNNTDGRKNVLFAGTIDVLVYDTNKKEYYILDLKTNTTSRTAAYNDPKTDKFNYKEKDSIQLSAYKQLIEYATNKDSKSEPIKITKGFILPLLTKKISKNDFSIDSVEMESKSLLEVSLNADINKLVEDYKKRPATKATSSKETANESNEKVSYSKSKFKVVSKEGKSRIFEDIDDEELNSLLIEKKFLVIDDKVVVPNQVDKKLVATYPVDRNGLKKGVQLVELTFFVMENGKKKYFNPELSKLLTADTPFFFTNFGKVYRNASKQVELKDNVVYFEVSKVLTGQKEGLELIKKIPTSFTFKEETKNKWLEIWNNENNFVSLQEPSNNSNVETVTTTVTTTTTKGKKIIKTIEESVDLSEIGEAELNEFTDSTLLTQAKLEYEKSGKKPATDPKSKTTPKINDAFNIDSLKPEAVEELLTEISEMSFANIETSQISAILES
ncbi:MAG TPA: PD-(D/E)XK nuclease family protein, partial [Candidatus Paceibacterota bacterium]|nr:PD-(D/E)XK nuclease family protein [Candidatus Paceibacterota bacterium]